MATATFTEVVDRAIGQALEEAIWDDQIKDNVNQLAGAHRNLLVNGAFEVWQRGTSGFTTPLGMYTADMWRYVDAGGSGTIAITRESSTKLAASTYALKAVYTKVAVNSQLTQRIENVAELRGRYLSLSVWVHQSVASGCRPFIADSAGTTYGSAVATTGSFVLLTVTRTVDSAATTLDAGVEFQSSGTYYLDNAMLSLSPVPAPFRPLHPQEELARCQRYYEVHGGVSGAMTFGGYGAAGGGAFQFVPFATPKGGVPTMTKNGTWNVANCGQPAATGPTVAGYTLQVTVTALGAFLTNCNSTDDTITAEWNPP